MAHVKKDKGKTYYQCNRAGSAKVKFEGRKRNFTGNVTCKTDATCSSHMVLTVAEGKYLVKYCVHHSSHEIESKFLRVLAATKEVIEDKLRNGVSHKNILDLIRKECDAGFNSSKYCSKKTIDNIMIKLGIGREYILDKSDALSVDALVKKDNEKSFFIYKPMGIVDASFPKAAIEDFMLGFMCKEQQELLIECMESPISALCIDSIHGTNEYQIKLTTLLSINALGKGVPVAFFFN